MVTKNNILRSPAHDALDSLHELTLWGNHDVIYIQFLFAHDTVYSDMKRSGKMISRKEWELWVFLIQGFLISKIKPFLI